MFFNTFRDVEDGIIIINHTSEKLMVICMKRFCFMQYNVVNYQFKTRDLKNVEKLVEQAVQALKS